MKRYISFTYESVENITNLCVTILFEKSSYLKEYGYVWHETFDGKKGDELFAKLLNETFPEGTLLDKPQFEILLDKAIKHLQTDKTCQDIQSEYLKKRHSYWVYSKWNNKVIPCHFAQHANAVQECVIEFFGDKSYTEFSVEDIKNFILSNFEIQSRNSTVLSISNDADYIYRTLAMREKRKREVTDSDKL